MTGGRLARSVTGTPPRGGGRAFLPPRVTVDTAPAPCRHARTCSTGVRFNFGAGSVPGATLSPPLEFRRTPIVMPGLVPGIHVGPPPRPLPARTATPRDVDGRNKSGHDVGGDVGGTGAATEPRRAPRARRNPCPDPADGPVTRFYQCLAPDPAHPNRTAMDLFRASTSHRRSALARSDLDAERRGCPEQVRA